ncbi:MAG: tetratricopeptide repeat protein [Candidatus Edwardsbacteria bacterium]
MAQVELIKKILRRLNELTGRTETVPDDKLESSVFKQLDQVQKIISAIQRYLPRRVIDKILLNPEGVKVEGERRPVTILFGDLSGFTAMSETMDPEQVVEVVNNYFDQMVEIASRYGGHIDKFMGDALMVLFGAPVVHEDDPLRACLAAIEMQEAMRAFSREKNFDLPLAMSIGINSGEVVALNVGSRERMEYTVMGDNVNLASRLEGVAQANEIVIGENTYRQVKGKIRLKKLPPVKVKGKTRPQNVYLILGRQEISREIEGVRPGSVKLVGRLTEMEQIHQALNKVKIGQGQVVAITGEPGIGKSRLAKELEILARDDGFQFVKGKCYSYTSGIAYLPYLRQLHTLLDIQDKDSTDKKRERLQKNLPSWNFSDYEPFLGQLLGLSYPEVEVLDPEKKKRKTFEAIRSIFLKAATQQPLTLAFEDLQWADSLSLELLEQLVEEVTDKSILICLDYRPELALPFIGKSYCLNLILSNLDKRESLQMVSALANVADVSDEVLDKMMGRTEGNPLFIEEIVRSLLSRRLVKREQQILVATKRFGKMALPHTVSTVVLSRIDKLEETLRKTLQYAAVIGKEFDQELLASLTRVSEETMQNHLENLEHFEGLLYSKEMEGKKTYEFHSTTTYEAAYGTLLKERRKELHGKVGQTLEMIYRESLEPHYEDLAHHYYNSKDQNKAVFYLHKAGDKARGFYANNEAIEFYQKGLSVLKHLELTRENQGEMAEVLWAEGAILRLVGQMEKALKKFNTATRIATKLLDNHAKRKFLLSAGIVYDMLGQPTKTLEILNKVLKDSESCGDKRAQATALANRGHIYLRGGNIPKAIEGFEAALNLYEKLKENKEIARVSGSLGHAYELMGNLPLAIEHYQKALTISKEINYLEGIALYSNSLGTPFLMTGQMDKATQYFSGALEVAKKIGDIRVESLSCLNLGIIQFMKGEHDEALRLWEQCLKIAAELSDLNLQMIAMINIGCVYQFRGLAEEARSRHQAAVKMAIQLQDKGNEIEARRNTGIDLAMLGHYQEALNQFSNALQLATQIGDPRMQAYIKANLGALQHQLGNREEGEKLLTESLDEALKVGDPEVILCALRGFVELKLDIGDYDSAQEQINRALRIAEDTQNKREKAYALLNLADLHFQRQELEEITGPLSEVLELAQQLKDKILLCRLYLLSAEKALVIKSYEEMENYLQDAISAAQEIESPDLFWQVHYLRGKMYGVQEMVALEKEEYEKAKEEIEKMKAELPEEMKTAFIDGTKRKEVYEIQ